MGYIYIYWRLLLMVNNKFCAPKCDQRKVKEKYEIGLPPHKWHVVTPPIYLAL